MFQSLVVLGHVSRKLILLSYLLRIRPVAGPRSHPAVHSLARAARRTPAVDRRVVGRIHPAVVRHIGLAHHSLAAVGRRSHLDRKDRTSSVRCDLCRDRL